MCYSHGHLLQVCLPILACFVGARQCNEESELNGSASICLMKALISRSTSSSRFVSHLLASCIAT